MPTASVSSFTLNDALSVPTSGYQTILPNGSNFSGSLDASLTDYAGAPILLDSMYQAFVVSFPSTGYGHNISSPSNAAKLSLPSPTSEVTNVLISDIADNKDGRDMQVAFDKAQDESTVS